MNFSKLEHVMKRHQRTVIGAMVCILASSGLSACRHKPVCERLAAKNKSCEDAFERFIETKAEQWEQSHPIPHFPPGSQQNVNPTPSRTIGVPGTGTKKGAAWSPAEKRRQALQLMRAKRKDAAKQEIRGLFTGRLFLESCTNAWAGNQKEDLRLKKAAEDCLAVTDCDAYVACIMNLKRKRQKTAITLGE